MTALVSKLDAQLQGEKAAAVAKETRERIATALTANSPGGDKLRSIARELAPLLITEPNSAELLGLRKRLAEAFSAGAKAATTPAALDALVTAAQDDEVLKLLGSEPAYRSLPAEAKSLREALVKAEEERIAAEQGELVLNAQPWGKVESVLNSERKAMELPADATTPFTLKLPAGNYVITIRHPQLAKPATIFARVNAKQRGVASYTFPTITAEDYFTRAGL